MPGPIPIRQLPQEQRARGSNLWLDALGSGADQGAGSPFLTPGVDTDALGPATRGPRRTEDIQLGGEFNMPSAPDAPDMFTKPAMQGLIHANIPPPTPEDELKAGFGGSLDDIDWQSEREGFYRQGNLDRQAREDQERSDNALHARQAMFPTGRTVEDELRDEAAFRGLQEARSMQDPAYARRQRVEDVLAGEGAYVDPRAKAARAMQRQEGLAGKAGETELGLKYGEDPRALAKEDRGFNRAREIEKIRATGRGGGIGQLLGMGGGGGGGGATVSMQDVQEFAQENGISVEEAAAQFERDGHVVAK